MRLNLRRSAVILASTADVFVQLADARRWPEWASKVHSARLVAGDGLAIGSEVEVAYSLNKVTYKVTAYKEPEQATLTMTAGEFVPTAYSLTCRPFEDGTHVTVEMNLKVTIWRMPWAPVLAAAARRRLRDDLREVKNYLERQGR